MDYLKAAICLMVTIVVQVAGQLVAPSVLAPVVLKVVTVKNLNPNLFDPATDSGYYPSLLAQIASAGNIKFDKPFLAASSISEAVDMVASGAAHVLAAPVESNDKYDSRINFTQPIFGTEVVLVMKNNSKAAHLTVLGASNVMDTILATDNNDFAEIIIKRLQRDNNKAGPVYVRKTDNVSATFDIIEKYDNTTFLGRKAAMQNLLPNPSRWPHLVLDTTPIGTLFSTLGVQSGKADLLANLNAAIADVDRRGCLRELFWKWFPNAQFIRRTEQHGYGRDKGLGADKPKVSGIQGFISSYTTRSCNV